MSRIAHHHFLVGYVDKGSGWSDRIYLKPTAENVANLIMQNPDARVRVTTEVDLPFVDANGGFILSCVDRDFLLYELQPAIIPIQKGEKEVEELDLYPRDDTEDY